MKATGKIKDVNIDFESNNIIFSLILNERKTAEEIANKLKDEEKLSIDISKYRKKRSLDANGYLWVLCDEIAKVIGSTKEEVYIQAVKEVGVFDYILLIEKAVDKFISNWKCKGLGWYAEKLDNSKIDGCIKVMAFYGSSVYNTEEMARLIDYVVEEAKELGIDTRTPEEIENMKSLWKNGR